MADHNVVAISPAAGRGTRVGGELPKQYRPLRGKPLLWHTLSRIESSPAVKAIILVVHPEDRALCRDHVLGEGEGFTKLRQLVDGGAERFESVRAGLQAAGEGDEIVVVHDAVRPFVSEALIHRVIAAAQRYDAAIAAVPAIDTIKEVAEGVVVRTPPRSRMWCAQTQQAFRRDLLAAAYSGLAPGEGATDEAGLIERLGRPVHIVVGEHENVKVTTAQDMEEAEWRMNSIGKGDTARVSRRVGQGYDVHRLRSGRDLILGGVRIEHPRGLEGHSDADVLTHAIIDALLGAAGLGDIGRQFPDSDPAYKDISSLILLERVGDMLSEQGVAVVNVDAVIVAQSPRLAPYMEGMSNALSRVMRLPPERISLKATTTEGLGFVGREEGIAAQAVALVDIQDLDGVSGDIH